MKTLLALLVVLLAATCAFAVVDPTPNSIGLYFDENADVYCVDGVENWEHVTMYLLLTNPTSDYIYG